MGRMLKRIIVTALSINLLLLSMPLEIQATGSTQQQIDAAEQNKDQLEQIMDQHEKELESFLS